MSQRVRLIVAACVAATLGFLITFYAAVNSAGVDPVEIAQRCATARPVWQNYQEDVKGQVGASATATWHGQPIRFELDGSTARLTMRLEGPWVDYPCAMPILLRDPLGHTAQNEEATGPGAERVYTFHLPAATNPPWVEIHFPHQERRLPLTGGQWRAE